MTALDELLAENRAYSDTYRVGLSNHASMALLALARLGASDDRLRAFWAHEQTMLEPFDPSGAEAAVRDRFRRALSNDGADAVLRATLPRLIEGVGAGAFHGVIRTAYARETGDDDELAAGLAHWERTYLDLGPAHNDLSRSNVDEAYDAARAVLGNRSFAGDLIFDRMTTVARDAAFADAAAFGTSATSLDDLVELTVAMFAVTADFTALHAMTGTFAMRSLIKYVDRDIAVRALWRALVAGYATVGMPPRPHAARRAELANETAAWDVIIAAAVGSNDDHVIKSVDVCYRIFTETGNAIAAAAATRWLRRVRALA